MDPSRLTDLHRIKAGPQGGYTTPYWPAHNQYRVTGCILNVLLTCSESKQSRGMNPPRVTDLQRIKAGSRGESTTSYWPAQNQSRVFNTCLCSLLEALSMWLGYLFFHSNRVSVLYWMWLYSKDSPQGFRVMSSQYRVPWVPWVPWVPVLHWNWLHFEGQSMKFRWCNIDLQLT